MPDVYDAIAQRYAPGAQGPGAGAPDKYDTIARFYAGRSGMPGSLSEATAMVPNSYPKGPQPYDATADMSPGDVTLAVFSRSIRNMGTGAKQRMLEYLASNGFSGPPTQEPWASLLNDSKKGVDIERKLSQNLMNAKGAFAGEALGSLPLLAMPAVKGTGAVAGALAGTLEPQGTQDTDLQALKNIGMGAGMGALGEKIGSAVLGPIFDKIGEAWRYATGKAPITPPPLPPAMQARVDAITSTGATPTRAQVTRSPADWTAQAEAAKATPAAMELAGQTREAQAQALEDSFNRMRQGAPVGGYEQSQAVHEAVQGYKARAKTEAGQVYSAAENAKGSDVPLDANAFWQRIQPVLDEQADSLPGVVKTRLQELQAGALANAGEMPAASGAPPRQLNVGELADLWKLINASTGKSSGQVQFAASKLKNAIGDFAETLPGDAAPAFDLFKTATSNWRTMKQTLEPKPIAAFSNAEEGAVTPELLQRQVKTAGPGDLAALKDLTATGSFSQPQNQAASQALHDSMIDYLVSAATSNANGSFSGAALKRAMDTIGTDRLAAVLSPQEMSRLSQLTLAAESMTTEPVGTAINRSNTASTFANLLKAGSGDTVTGAALGGLVEPVMQSLGLPGGLSAVGGAALGKLTGVLRDRAAANNMRGLLNPDLEQIAAEAAGMTNPGSGAARAIGQSTLPQAFPSFAALMLGQGQ